MRTRTRSQRVCALATLTACLLFSAPTAAEQDGASVDERAQAADAYDRGTAAYLSQEYERAAHWFERAYRTVPTAAALLQAARAHAKAGDWIRAGNLALELRDRYPNEASANEAAATILARAEPANVRVHVDCLETCTLELDGALITHQTFLVAPDVEHVVRAAFDSGEVSADVQGPPGGSKRFTLEAPAPPPPPPIPRWAFYSSLGSTVVLGAVTVWSGIDANRGVNAYESAARNARSPGINGLGSPTPAEQAQSLLDEGQRKERRTNILIGVTASMAVTTAVLGVFTNWKGESRERNARRLEPSVGVARKAGGLTIKGRF